MPEENRDAEQQPPPPPEGKEQQNADNKAIDRGVNGEKQQNAADAAKSELPAVDEFGLPLRPARRRDYGEEDDEERESGDKGKETAAQNSTPAGIDTAVTAEPTPEGPISPGHAHKPSVNTISEFSHQQQMTRPPEEEKAEEEDEWQEMPALATHRIYDDWGKVLAKEYGEVDDEQVAYGTLGGAGKGYTRVQMDEDAGSATSLDDHTAYLFKEGYSRNVLNDDDEEGRDLLSQMQTTKELLTEAQRVAYVGVVRLSIAQMAGDLKSLDPNKQTKKALDFAIEGLRMWGQKMMLRLYNHMEIDAREQIMVEQLSDHGVLPGDLTSALMQNARVKNPNVSESGANSRASSARASTSTPRPSSGVGSKTGSSTNLTLTDEKNLSATHLSPSPSAPSTPSMESPPPPAYENHNADQLTIQDPEDLQNVKNLDLDIRWTVLCDLFLLMISDSTYDARARQLLELVGRALEVPWQEICRFEKRVTDALEMQEHPDKENWNEDEHLEERRKAAQKKRLVVMGMCTVGGGLVIGLSAGLLAPVIGAGLAAGFTTIGVAGTGSFLGGTGAAALIGTTGTLIGGKIGLTTSHRRTGAVKTYEYKPLFNNKRVNLIVTVAGWMTGNVDDVRLPFSTIDPVMGDIYAVNWEPEMLQSTGQTIQILGTEALTQTIQQVLGATFLATLMAGLSPPLILMKMSYLIDNPWTVSLARADATGLILADSILARNLGIRPITLVGFSLGSRVIFSCLKELSRRGGVGLVQNVYMFGSPVVVKKDEYIRCRSIVPGRFVNGYATNDWILGYLFRATSGGIMRVAGLASVEGVGVENIDVTDTVPGHMAYREMMPTLLDKVGWNMTSLEYTEIEDPDPDNHAKRQRELLDEIEAARRELEAEPEKRGFKRFFQRSKGVGKKKDWEMYDERSNSKVLEGEEGEVERINNGEGVGEVMFDVEAIRKEALKLAVQTPGDLEEIKRHLSVREIEGTLPVLKLPSSSGSTTIGAGSPTTNGGRPAGLAQSKSYGGLASPKASDPEEENVTLEFENDGRSGGHRSFTAPGLSASGSSTPRSQQQGRFGSGSTTPVEAAGRPGAFRSVSGNVRGNPWNREAEEEGWGNEEEEVTMTFA